MKLKLEKKREKENFNSSQVFFYYYFITALIYTQLLFCKCKLKH